MLAYPAHIDPVAALGQHIAHPLFRCEQFALLVDDDARQRWRECDAAGIWFRLAS